MAAAHVGGAVPVLQNRPEVHAKVPPECALPKPDTTNALAVKALLLNSANFDTGVSGWKPDAGWGWANLSNAIQQLDLGVKLNLPVVMASCVQTPLMNPPVNTPARHYRFFKSPVDALPTHLFKATLAWDRHVTWGPVNKLAPPNVWSNTGSANPVVAAEPSHLRLRMYDTATNVRLDKDPPPNTHDPRNNVQQHVYAQNVQQLAVKRHHQAD